MIHIQKPTTKEELEGIIQDLQKDKKGLELAVGDMHRQAKNAEEKLAKIRKSVARYKRLSEDAPSKLKAGWTNEKFRECFRQVYLDLSRILED